jgi:transcription elongation factor GreA
MNVSQSLGLAEAASRFLASLPPEEGKTSQQAVYRFVRWYGGQRPLAGLIAREVANYAERLPSSDTNYNRKLQLVRAFLTYARKAGWTKSNLAVHLKVKKGKDKAPPVTRPGTTSLDIALTQQGYDEIKAELATLETKRAQAINEVRLAAADKDIRENAPLAAAREQHGRLVGRIRELEEAIKSAVIIDDKRKTTATVSIGNSVVLQDLGSGEKLHYKIVSPREVDPSRGSISNASPVGKAVIGQKKDAIIEVTTPTGKIRYQIKRIER